MIVLLNKMRHAYTGCLSEADNLLFCAVANWSVIYVMLSVTRLRNQHDRIPGICFDGAERR